MITLHLSLDLIPSGVLPRLNVSQYDHGQTVDVTLYEGSTAYTLPSGATVTVSGTKADHTGFEYNCTTTGGLSFTIADQMTVFAGEVECELTIRYGNNRISTINFILDVERAALQDDVVISETDLPIIQQLPEKLAEAETYADQAEQAAATAMSTDAGKVTDRLNLNNTRNLVVPADINYTHHGVTIVTNDDGSITLSGQNDTSEEILLWYNILSPNRISTVTDDIDARVWLTKGNYNLWCDEVGGRIRSNGTTLAFMYLLGYDENGMRTLTRNTNRESKVDFPILDDVKILTLRLVAAANADFGNGMTIYPMITTQSTADVTGYEQGALSNKMLTMKNKILDDLDYGEDSLMNEGIKYPVINGIRNYTDSNDVYNKKLGCVDLGTLPWEYYSTYDAFYTPDIKTIVAAPSSNSIKANVLCAKYPTGVVAPIADKTISIAMSGNLFIKDTTKGTDAAAFKSAMSGVLLFYELATPQTWNTKSIVGLDALATTNKTLIGAINELKARIDTL